MDLSNIPFDDITANDIEQLVTQGTPEGRRYIEYKTQLPGSKDPDKREFLADITSFANTSGGDMLFGISEKGGVPQKPYGLTLADKDAEMRKLQDIMRDGARPRLLGVRCRYIETEPGKVIFVFRVPRSWMPPHQVTHSQSMRFYGRDSNGKHMLDTEEMRPLFASTATASDRMTSFRVDRLLKITSNTLPVELREVPKVVVHVVPLGNTAGTNAVDIFSMHRDPGMLGLAGYWGIFTLYNFDGALFSGTDRFRGWIYRTLLLFMNGASESVDTTIANDDRNIQGPHLEMEILKAVTRMCKIQRRLTADAPVMVAVSLVGVKGSRVFGPQETPLFAMAPIDRNELVIPGVVLGRGEIRLDVALKPVFDMIWAASGWPGSVSYDERGEWKYWKSDEHNINEER